MSIRGDGPSTRTLAYSDWPGFPTGWRRLCLLALSLCCTPILSAGEPSRKTERAQLESSELGETGGLRIALPKGYDADSNSADADHNHMSVAVVANLDAVREMGSKPEHSPPAIEAFDQPRKRRIVQRVAELVRDHYVFEDLGAEMAEHVLAGLKSGAYDGHSDLKTFCSDLTADLRVVSEDKHIFVFQSAEEAKEVAADKGLLSEEETARVEAAFLEEDRAEGFGVVEIKTLPGRVGYLRLDYFSSHTQAREAIESAMAELASTNAMIIDLRANGGGGGGGVGRLLASYFMGPEPAPLTGVFWRSTGETIPARTLAEIPGKRRPDVPLYLLTSSRTFSAAEDFSYSLKHLGRATVVGEPTKGGAHPVDVLIIEDDVLLQVPIGRSVNPITGTNWESVGVQPDISTSADGALEAAHRNALEKLIQRTDGAREGEILAQALAGLD